MRIFVPASALSHASSHRTASLSPELFYQKRNSSETKKVMIAMQWISFMEIFRFGLFVKPVEREHLLRTVELRVEE